MSNIKKFIDLKVTSLDEYIKLINFLYDNGKKKQLYFRGEKRDYQTKNGYSCQPGLFRPNTNPEEVLISEFKRHFPQKINNLSNNVERLTYMQHYGLPTRLLDISFNPLSALYFATEAEDEYDGYVYIFKDSNEQKYSDTSDTLEILATLAFMDEECKEGINSIITKFISSFKSITSGMSDDVAKAKYEEYYQKRVLNNFFESYDIKLSSMFNKLFSDTEKYPQGYQLVRLYHAIRKDVGDFEANIDFLKLQDPIIMISEISNERIRNQEGAFIFVPDVLDSKSKRLYKEINEKIKNLMVNPLKCSSCQEYANNCCCTCDSYEVVENKVIRIKVKEKKKIRDQLDRLGFNSAKIYPDEQNLSNYIKNAHLK